MPSTIPYDPSLIIGNVMNTNVLNLISQINVIQSVTDAAQEKMSSFIMMKRSLAMTVNELAEMGIDISSLTDKIGALDSSISQSAQEYLVARLEGETKIQQLKQSIGEATKTYDDASPIDFMQSKIETLPLASESIKIDAQYFTFGSNTQNDALANIERYVRESTSELGARSNEISATVSAQVSNQMQNHSLAGTLIITASATHRHVSRLDPVVLDVENAVDVWNKVNSDSRIDLHNPQTWQLETKDGKDPQPSFSIISGAVYGSSFVGMVHILNTESDAGNVDNNTLSQLRDKMQLGGWVQNMSGDIGIDSDILEDVKKFLSTKQVSAHVSIVATGATPSLASGDIKLGLNKVLQSDSDKNLSLIQSVNQLTNSETASVSTDADEARKASRLMKIQQANTSSTLRALAAIDHGTNKVLDINSLMAAFENYIQAVRSAQDTAGVPIRFFVKRISANALAIAIAKKYSQ